LAKKKIEKPKHKPTRRQLSRWQKQKRRQRFIIGFGVSVVLIALGLVWAGIYYQWYVPQEKPLKETVAKVNEASFDMAYFVDTLKYQLGGMSSQQAEYYLDFIVNGIQQNELIRQQSIELGITVSDDEVNEKIKNDKLPGNQAVADQIRAQLLIQKLKEGYFNEQISAFAKQRHIMAMFLESKSQVNEVRGRLAAGEDFSQLAGELSLESYTKENNGELGWRPEGIVNGLLLTSVLEEYVFSFPVGEVSVQVYDAEKTKDFGYWLIEVLERNEEKGETHVRAMMLASEEEAQMILSRLTIGGEAFEDLARDFSQTWSDKDGADLGWIVEGDVSGAFSEFAFNPETGLNSISTPIRDEDISTKGGFWLFKVPEGGVRDISKEDRDLLIEQAMQKWLESLWNDAKNIIESYLNNEMRGFAISKLSGQ